MKPKTLIVGAALVAWMSISGPLRAAATAVVNLTGNLTAFQTVEELKWRECGGIRVLRGRTTDPGAAQQAYLLVQKLGYARIANLIRVVEPPNDAAIARTAERRLAMHRALDGCSFRVDSQQGIVTVDGKVQSELQKDVALGVLRNIDGVRGVKTNFQ